MTCTLLRGPSKALWNEIVATAISQRFHPAVRLPPLAGSSDLALEDQLAGSFARAQLIRRSTSQPVSMPPRRTETRASRCRTSPRQEAFLQEQATVVMDD